MMTAKEAKEKAMNQVEVNTANVIADIESEIEEAVNYGRLAADYVLPYPVHFDLVRRYFEELGYCISLNHGLVEVYW